MTNLERLAGVLLRWKKSEALRGELEHYAETSGEFDEAEALFDVEDMAERDGNKALLRECREVLIQACFYSAISERELSGVAVTSGKKYAFKLYGVKYRGDHSSRVWLEE